MLKSAKLLLFILLTLVTGALPAAEEQSDAVEPLVQAVDEAVESESVEPIADGEYLIDESESIISLPGDDSLAADPDAGDQAMQGLDSEIQDLKEEVLILNRELFSLEEELLFPSSTQFAVYVSVDVGEFFEMESVRVMLDNKPVASYLYTERESDALMRGGVHRIYMGNLSAGSHELVAYYTGRGPRGRDFKRATTRTIVKEMGPKYVELKISDNKSKKQSGFTVKEW